MVSAPSVNDAYYADYFDAIISYDIAFAKTVLGKDKNIVLADRATMPYLRQELPDSILLEANIADIWIRDFAPVVPDRCVKFDYRPRYLPRSDADWIDNSFENWFLATNLVYGARSNIILDGGNFVYNGSDKAIVTQRVLEDNPSFSREQIESEIKEKTCIAQLAIIPCESGDVTGHADGMVMWIDKDKLCVSRYDEPFRSELMGILRAAFPDISIIEIPSDWDGRIYNGFPSACGIYANGIMTARYIYLPVYNMVNDSVVAQIVQSHTHKQVIPIDASGICILGGSVRCLTWQVKGQNMERLLELAKEK